jgi:hypothetical protein
MDISSNTTSCYDRSRTDWYGQNRPTTFVESERERDLRAASYSLTPIAGPSLSCPSTSLLQG